MSALAIIEDRLPTLAPQFNAVLSDKSINFQREIGYAVQLLRANDYTAKIAASNLESLDSAINNVAAIGISLNPAKRQAYLVPRKVGTGDSKRSAVCLDIGYMGLIEIAVGSGSVLWAQAELVYQNDRFVMRDVGQAPLHERDPLSKDRGQVTGAYCVAKTHDGSFLVEVMSIDEINAIRDRSEAWKNGQKGPWKSDPHEMQRKTVIKRAYKYWPKTDRMSTAVHMLDTQVEPIEFEPIAQQDVGFDGDAFVARAAAARSDEALMAIYREFVTAAAKLKDTRPARAVKDRIVEIRKYGQACSYRNPYPAGGNGDDIEVVAHVVN